MTKTYAVHYGNANLVRCSVVDTDFRTLDSAQRVASKLAKAGYGIVIIADTDGNEWDCINGTQINTLA